MASLAGLLPETAAAWAALDAYARSRGIGITVADFGGVRTQADTSEILAYRQQEYTQAIRTGTIPADTTIQRFRPINAFGTSWHNYGAAFDVHIESRPASMSVDAALATLGAYAPSIGMRWGGRFTNPDPPHFELAISLSEAQARYQAFAASGGAASGGGLFGLNFDLSALLPGLTPSAPSDEAIAPTLEIPNIGAAVLPNDEAGEIAFEDESSDDGGGWVDGGGVSDGGGDPTQVSLVLMGLVVAGVLVWAVRRKFA